MRLISNIMRFDLILDNPVGDKLSNISINRGYEQGDPTTYGPAEFEK